MLAQSLLAFSVECDNPQHFRGYLRNRKIADVEFIEMATGRHVAHRDAEAIRRDSRPDYVVCLQVAGVGEFHQGARTAVLRPGDLTVFDSTRPTTVVSSADYRNVCIKFPQNAIRLPHAQVGQLTAERISADDGLAPATGALLTTMSRVMEDISGQARHLAARTALDLVATMFQSVLDVAEGDRAGERDVVFAHIREYIDEHLGDPELTPAEIAAAQFISLRKLQNLFQENGETVASWIRFRRLEMCRRDLVTGDAISVAAVGRRWGFKTPSHFGRAFKDEFGLTPAEFRRDATTG